MESNRQLAAIMFTDIQGYTAMMGNDEARAIGMVDRYEQVMHEGSAAHGGEIVNFYGDGCLCLFPSALNAARSSIEIQRAFIKAEIPVRLGLHLGDVVMKKGNAYGDSVNIASRIESLGQAGAVLLSEDIYKRIQKLTDFECVKMDDFEFKNVDHPLSVYAIHTAELHVPLKGSLSGKLKEKKQLEPSIAVLPFECWSPKEADEFIAAGISDEIRNHLTAVDSLKVISRASSINYTNKAFSLQQLADELGVNYVLQGRIQFAGSMIKLNAELSSTQDQQQLWSSPGLTKPLDDLFELQNLIAKTVVEELKLLLSIEDRLKLEKVPTSNREAYESYQRGQDLMHRGNGNIHELQQTVQLFQEAIRLDPLFSRAYLGMTEAYLDHIFWGRSTTNSIIEPATTAALKALELDESNGEVFGALGGIELHKLNVAAAETYIEKSIRMSPSYLSNYEKMAWIKVNRRQYDEAIQMLEMASKLDPHSIKYATDYGHVYYYQGAYDKGLEHVASLLDNHPSEPWILWMKGYLLAAKGEYNLAIQAYNQRETVGKKTNWMLAYCLGKSGQTEEAEAILDFHLNKLKFTHIPAYMIATIYAGLGNDDLALEWLQKDLEEGGLGLFFINLEQDPKFTHLHERADFKKLLEAIK